MAKGRASTSQHIIRQMFILNAEGMTPNKIAERLNIAANTVRKHLADKSNIEQYGDLMSEIEQMHIKSNNDVIDLIKSTRYSDITNNIIELLNKENLETELATNGIRNLINLLGNTVDKTLALKRTEIQEREYTLKERTLAIKERELELKEKELNARIDNPDAFATVTIINDAPKDYYGLNSN